LCCKTRLFFANAVACGFDRPFVPRSVLRGLRGIVSSA
jgi:hypothetical protein